MMHDGHEKVAWNHTSVLAAMIVNSTPFRKGKPIPAERFHPYLQKKEKREADDLDVAMGWSALKSLVKKNVKVPPPTR